MCSFNSSSSQWQDAVDMYRHVIKICEEHSNDAINVDRLQRIHTLENLADLLDAGHSSISVDQCSINDDQSSVSTDQNPFNNDQNTANNDHQCSSSVDQSSVNVDQSSANSDQGLVNTDQSSVNGDQSSANSDQSVVNTDQSSASNDQCSSSADQSSDSGYPLRDEDLRSEVCYYSDNVKCNNCIMGMHIMRVYLICTYIYLKPRSLGIHIRQIRSAHVTTDM